MQNTGWNHDHSTFLIITSEKGIGRWPGAELERTPQNLCGQLQSSGELPAQQSCQSWAAAPGVAVQSCNTRAGGVQEEARHPEHWEPHKYQQKEHGGCPHTPLRRAEEGRKTTNTAQSSCSWCCTGTAEGKWEQDHKGRGNYWFFLPGGRLYPTNRKQWIHKGQQSLDRQISDYRVLGQWLTAEQRASPQQTPWSPSKLNLGEAPKCGTSHCSYGNQITDSGSQKVWQGCSPAQVTVVTSLSLTLPLLVTEGPACCTLPSAPLLRPECSWIHFPTIFILL